MNASASGFFLRGATLALCLFMFELVGRCFAGEIPLPDPLTLSDGRTVQAPARWEARRAEFFSLYETHVYAPRIRAAAKASFEVRSEKLNTLGGSAVRGAGEGGAALARRKQGERIADSVKKSGYWYTPRYRDYVDREEFLPVEAHWLMALIMPRPLYVSCATKDLWAYPDGEFLAAKHAGAVYGLWGYQGVKGAMPAPDTRIGERIGYHVRTGVHDILEDDWKHHLDFAYFFLEAR